ncbi:MAG: hypothetical protein ACJ8AW_22830, partial [Rhodopila sp.]
VAPNTVFNFPTGGVSTFTVTGIDPADNLDPTNATAFTGLTFVADGTFNVSGALPPLVLDDFKVAVWVSSATASVHRCGFAASR